MKHGSHGVALPVVLWSVIVLSGLSIAVVTFATLDLSLTRNQRDHVAALGVAEAGVAETLAALVDDPVARSSSDSLRGDLETGGYRSSWEPTGDGVRVVSVGVSRTAHRTVEAWVSSDAGGALRISAWREVR